MSVKTKTDQPGEQGGLRLQSSGRHYNAVVGQRGIRRSRRRIRGSTRGRERIQHSARRGECGEETLEEGGEHDLVCNGNCEQAQRGGRRRKFGRELQAASKEPCPRKSCLGKLERSEGTIAKGG